MRSTLAIRSPEVLIRRDRDAELSRGACAPARLVDPRVSSIVLLGAVDVDKWNDVLLHSERSRR
jgi:hypothetical protein